MKSVIVLLLAMFIPGLLGAQEPIRTPAEERPSVVFVTEKSPFVAGALEILIPPTIGYAYAGHWSRSIPSALVRVVGIWLSLDQIAVTPYGSAPPCEAECNLGTAMFIGGTVWAVIDAAGTARRRNEKVREELIGVVVSPMVVEGRPGIGVRVSVPW